MNNLNKDNYRFICLIMAFLLIYGLLTDKASANTAAIDRINYKLVNEHGETTMHMETSQGELTFYLLINPEINSKYPALFSIFMNGRQVECYWNDSAYPAKELYTIIENKEEQLVKITIANIPSGLNTLQFGIVYHPEIIHYEDDDLLHGSYLYKLDLTPFTIVRGERLNWPDSSLFLDYISPEHINRDMPVGMDGMLTFIQDQYSPKILSPILKDSMVYYYWKNTDTKARKVRFSLLCNWEQVQWPSGDLFIDVLVKPGDIYYKELLLSEITNNGVNELSVIAFIDPDISFWYYEKNNNLRANHYGSLAFASFRCMIFLP